MNEVYFFQQKLPPTRHCRDHSIQRPEIRALASSMFATRRLHLPGTLDLTGEYVVKLVCTYDVIETLQSIYTQMDLESLPSNHINGLMLL